MSDYSKLTVAKLKDELDKRKLPKTGLKAALVQRLEEADAQAEATQTAPTSGVENQPREAPEPYNHQVQEGELAIPEDLQPGEPMEGVAVEAQEQARDPLTSGDEAVIAPTTDQVAQKPRSIAEQSQRTAEPPSTELATSQAPPSTATSDILPGNLTQNASREHTFDAHLPTPALTQTDERDTHASIISTQASIGPEEMAEDSRKRKRRSQSPAPSSIETSKRLRAEEATDLRPEVNLPEDYPSSQNAITGPSQEARSSQNLVNGDGEATSPESSTMEDVAPTRETAKPSKNVVVPPQEVNAERSVGGAGGESVQQTSPLAEETSKKESPHKTPTPDQRFKSLAAPSSEPKPHLTSESDLPTNDIPSSIHPATSALYIRNLMRPLNPAGLKSHLISLARPPSSSPDASSASDIINTLHIDSIRTHALIRFSNIAAASRVRASLHNRPWPAERDRKALWIDFVPEDKVSNWIEVETSQSGSGARGGSNTRWEVVYETGDDGVEAYLQEAGAAGAAASGPSRISQSGPSAAAAAAAPPPPPLIKPAAESKEFKALDDLFSSTAAKPKLYYLPVERSIVEKRLALLDEGKGGGRGDEMLRYSFEDGIIVEKGPEFGRGFRGARSGRRGGGYSDVYRGRGSGGGGGGGRGRTGDGAGFRGGGGYRIGEADRARGWGTY